jgi:hypothetical protein
MGERDADISALVTALPLHVSGGGWPRPALSRLGQFERSGVKLY